MKSVSAPSSEEVSIWINLLMGGLTIVGSVLVTKYFYTYLRMAMDTKPPQNDESDSDLENNAASIPVCSTPPVDNTNIMYPPSPLPSRQRIVPI
jgi:hypothetical protein